MAFSGNLWFLFLVFWPIAGAIICYSVSKRNAFWRDFSATFVVATVFICMVIMAISMNSENQPYFRLDTFMGFGLYFKLDGFRAIYGVITVFLWLATTLFSKEYFTHYHNQSRYYLFLLITLGGTLGVFLSADLITTFIFFEIMSIASYVLVIHDEKQATLEAARTYLAVAVIGGIALLLGILIIANQLQTTEIALLHTAMQEYTGNMSLIYFAAACMMIGFGGKAGMFPLHIWLPNAHPVAPAPASALLSGILTKTGVFGIIIIGARLFHGDAVWGFVILNIGIIGMFLGALLAVFSTDLKRTLAYSSVSQIGFIILGVGMHGILTEYYNSLAVQGTMLHMVNHSLIKLLLFLAAGVIVMNVHELDFNKIRGFARGKPLLIFCFLIGGLALIGMPLISGYVSKTLLHETLIYHLGGFEYYNLAVRYFQIAEGLFTLTGGLTTAYVIKLFVCICVEKNHVNQEKFTKLNKRYMNRLSSITMFICALVLLVLGINPNLFMLQLGAFGKGFMLRFYPAYEIDFWDFMIMRGALVSILIGIVIYTIIVRICLTSRDESGNLVYVNYWPASLDIEKMIYRPLILRILPFAGAFVARTFSSILPVIAETINSGFKKIHHFWQEESVATKSPDLQKSAFEVGSSIDDGKERIITAVEHLMLRPDSKVEHLMLTPDSKIERAINAVLHQISTIKANIKARFIVYYEKEHEENAVQRLMYKLRVKLRNGYISNIFGSLAYSLLIFLVGFVIIQIIILT